MTIPFSEVKSALAPDGALRDFYVFGISPQEWERFISIVPSIAQRSVFTWGEQELPLPNSFGVIQEMQQQNPTNLTMWVSGQTVCCHFFIDSEIELDFRPNEFQDQTRWDDLVAFFQAIVDAIGKKGVITLENCEDHVIDEITPGQRLEDFVANRAESSA